MLLFAIQVLHLDQRRVLFMTMKVSTLREFYSYSVTEGHQFDIRDVIHMASLFVKRIHVEWFVGFNARNFEFEDMNQHIFLF